MKKNITTLFLFLFLFGINSQAILAQKNVYKDVVTELNSGAKMTVITPFALAPQQVEKSVALPNQLENYQLFVLDKKAIRDLNLNKGKSFQLIFASSPKSKKMSLDLIESRIFASDFQLRDSRRVITDFENYLGSHYQGVVSGDPNSLVSISIFENEISGIISTDEGNWNLGKVESAIQDDVYIMFLDKDIQDQFQIDCETPDDGQIYKPEALEFVDGEKAAGDCVRVFVEVDYEITVDKGGVAGAAGWVTGLFNECITLYNNDGIEMIISEMFVWDQEDPYTSTNSSTRLDQFQNYRNGFNGDLAHLVDLGNSGIAAGFSGLCNNNEDQSMCISGVFNSYANVPTWSWSVSVVTHEMGHLLGSRHTHACVWNGNGTAIDGCARTEGSCRRPRPLPAEGGTIMSYCHNANVGINFNLGFGPQPAAVILNNINNANCTAGCSTGNHCFNGVLDADETGIDCGGVDCIDCPTCSDGIQNGSETGIDCGGPDCPACPPSNCDVPANLYADQIKRVKARLNWDAVTDATNYTARIRAQGGTWQENTVSGTSITYTGLSNGVTYEWGVRANCVGGQSDWSSVCSFVAGDSGSGACSGGANVYDPASGLSLFPNPATSELYLMLPSSFTENAKIEVYDMMGRKHSLQSSINSSEVAFNISNLQTGVYLLRYSDGTLEKTIKFIVEK